MVISLNTNTNVLTSQRNLSLFNSNTKNIINRLSSGIRINSAKDDAANLSLSKNIESKNSGLKVANKNMQIGLTKLQTLDSFLGGLSTSLHQMRDLTVQSANGVYAQEERALLDQEAQQLMGEIEQGTKIANKDMKSLDGGASTNSIDQLTEAEAIAQNYKIIRTAEQLASIDTEDLDGKYILMENIDMSSFNENNAVINNCFTGELNGNGYKISNLTINSSSTHAALIGATNDAKLENIALENIKISSLGFSGGLVGYAEGGSISNCYVTGSISGGNTAGGLSSTADACSISNCHFAGSVSGIQDIGGLIGYNNSTITNSYSTGTVSGELMIGGFIGRNVGDVTDCHCSTSTSGEAMTGGFIGNNSQINWIETHIGTISNCYATGSVSGINFTGGLVGLNESSLTNSYATGSISGEIEVGGLVGSNCWAATTSNSYATGSVSGLESVGGLVGRNGGPCTVDNSFATGSVSGEEDVGGMIGYNKGTVESSYTTGFVNGDTDVGAFIGFNEGDCFGAPVNNTNFWNTDIMETGLGRNEAGTFEAQGLTTKQIASEGTSILGSSWSNNGVTAMQNVFDKQMSMQVGADKDDSSNMDIENIQINTNFDIDLSSSKNSLASMNILDNALNYISSERAKIGSKINRLESMINSNTSRSDELTESISTIRDTDMGNEAANLARVQILSQSATNILQQAKNINSNLILSLVQY